MAARLKVFTWSDGFHAYTVAAPSRPKALAAWGLTGDIFKTGLACEAPPDALDRTAALAAPGSVITRGLAVDVGKTTRRKPPVKTAASEKARKRVADLEARLAALESAQSDARRVLNTRRAALDQELARLEQDQATARESLAQDLGKARAAVR